MGHFGVGYIPAGCVPGKIACNRGDTIQHFMKLDLRDFLLSSVIKFGALSAEAKPPSVMCQ